MTRESPIFRRLPGLEPRTSLPFICNAQALEGKAGDTVAAALLVQGISPFRLSHDGGPRAPYCLMGICQDCRVTINDVADQRACRTVLAAGMVIRTHTAGDGQP